MITPWPYIALTLDLTLILNHALVMSLSFPPYVRKPVPLATAVYFTTRAL